MGRQQQQFIFVVSRWKITIERWDQEKVREKMENSQQFEVFVRFYCNGVGFRPNLPARISRMRARPIGSWGFPHKLCVG